MSTILDALKKSEQERRLNNLPTLSDMPAPQERSRWPLILLGAIFAAVLLGLIWVLSASDWFGDDQQQNAMMMPTEQQSEIAPANAQNAQIAADVDSDALVVNVISYSDDPQVRFAIINGKLFREAQFVKAGVKVESILPDSVVLIERGERITVQP